MHLWNKEWGFYCNHSLNTNIAHIFSLRFSMICIDVIDRTIPRYHVTNSNLLDIMKGIIKGPVNLNLWSIYILKIWMDNLKIWQQNTITLSTISRIKDALQSLSLVSISSNVLIKKIFLVIRHYSTSLISFISNIPPPTLCVRIF